jgi:hypothetical protein
MRKLSSATIEAVPHCVYSVKDLTVPYMTAYVDPEDPFLNYRTDGLTVYVALHFTNAQADSLLGIMTINTSHLSNLSPFLTLRPPNTKLLVISRSGSDLTDHPFRLAFSSPSRSIW